MIRVVHVPEGMQAPVEPTELGSSIVPEAAATSRVCGEVTRLSIGGSEPQTIGVTRHQVSHAGVPGGSIAATLNSMHGKPSVELSPGDPSSRTLVQTAEREGLIRWDGSRWVDVVGADGKPATLPAEEQPAAQADPGADVFDPEDDQLWAADIEPLPQHAYDAGMASMVNVIANGVGSFEDTAKSLAVNAGIPPTLALDYVTQGHTMFKGAVDRALAKDGLTGERLERAYESMRAQPAALQQALQSLLHLRDVSGFRRLAADFISKNPV